MQRGGGIHGGDFTPLSFGKHVEGGEFTPLSFGKHVEGGEFTQLPFFVPSYTLVDVNIN